MKGNILLFLKKHGLALLFVVLVLGFVAYNGLIYKGKTAETTKTVIIRDDGFYPTKILVSEGDTVTWVNEGEKTHWPASNFHPNHTLYPEDGGCLGSKLDSCKGLAKGESFSFTFNKLGLWPMHDHLYPGLVMTVEVVKMGEASSSNFTYNKNTTPEEFRKMNYDSQIEFIRIRSEKNPKESWEFLKQAFVVNGQVVGNAHEMAHIIGNASYKKSGLKGIGICDATYAYGCFHGVTEGMLLKEGTSKVKDIENGCLAMFPPQVSEDYTGCIHGTGHGLYTWEGGDIKKALLDCDMVSEPYRQYCYDGVFMENASSGEMKKDLGNDPWKFCTDLDERYHHNCARYQSQFFFMVLKDPELVGKNCSLGNTKILRETCYESLGYYIAQQYVGVPSKIIVDCAKMPTKEGIAICTTGSAIETIFQRYGDYKASAKILCDTLPEANRSTCEQGTARIIKAYGL